MLNLSVDRYRFAVGLGAALLRGHTSLLPPNHIARHGGAAARALRRRLRARRGPRPTTTACRRIRHAPTPAADARGIDRDPAIDPDLRRRLRADLGLDRRAGAACQAVGPAGPQRACRGERASPRRSAAPTSPASPLVATVPAQHMYGFESSVLIALHGGAVARCRAAVLPGRHRRRARPRRRAARAGDDAVPPEDAARRRPRRCRRSTSSSARPRRLSPQLAARAEAALGAPLLEIYGCTEAGQVATRRTTAGAEWRTFDGMRARRRRRRRHASAAATCRSRRVLADVLEVVDAERFRLLGRSNDLINVAGKRSSLGHLELPPQLDRRRRRRRLLDAARATATRRRRPPGRLRRRAAASRASAIVAAPARARRRGVPAAPHRPCRRAAARGDRQADRGAARGARGAPPARGERGDERRRRRLARGRDRAPTIRPSPATSPASRVLPGVALLAEVLEAALASPRSPRCVGADAAPRRSSSSSRRSRPGAALVIDFALGDARARWRVREGDARRRQRPDRARRHRRGAAP